MPSHIQSFTNAYQGGIVADHASSATVLPRLWRSGDMELGGEIYCIICILEITGEQMAENQNHGPTRGGEE